MSTAPKEFYLPFAKKEKVAKDTYSFYFDLAQRGFDFLPGQYIRMTLDIKNPDNRGNSRSFTIASSPLEKEYIMITTKVVSHSGDPSADGDSRISKLERDSGQDGYQTVTRQARMTGYEICSSFKKNLLELKAGESVRFFGPMGGFVLKEEEKEAHVFLAGGIGITPFHSMITYANAKNLIIPITLLVSFSTLEEMVFYEELVDIAKKNPNIKVAYSATRPEESSIKWEGETGRISEVLIKKYVSNILEPQYFIVGPPAMVAAMEDVVRNIGVANEKIFIENFTGY